jgi:hypothetical protein
MKKWLQPLAATLLFLGSSVLADTIGWHPDLQGIRTGRGVDLRNQKELKNFVAVMGTNTIGTPAGGRFEQNVRYVQDTFDLAQSFSLNASLSIRSRMFSGSVGYSLAESYSASGNSITFAMDCARVLGDELFPVLQLDPDFTNTVINLRQSLSGAALHQAISDRYGTHYVSGMQRAFKAVMLYTFTFQSQASARAQSLSLSARYRGGVASASFSADVASLLAQKDSRVTMTYRFMSTDPLAPPPPFATNSVITNMTQFTLVAGLFEDYCRTNDLSGANPINYTVEPLQNLPGYLALLGGYNPASIFLPNYSEFMQTFSEFKSWEDLLNYWMGDPRRMNWLNTNGQKMVFSMRSEVTAFLNAMRDTARSHFTNETPLEISADILNYRANLAQIPIPRVVILSKILIGRGTEVEGNQIGYVNCGPRSLTVANPFQAVVLTHDGLELGNEPSLYSSAEQFVSSVHSFVGSHTYLQGWMDGTFSDPKWSSVLAATNDLRISFFRAGHSFPSSSSGWNGAAINLKDAATPSQIVDSQAVMESRTDQLSLDSATTGNGDVRLLSKGSSSAALVGRVQALEFIVTNAGPGSVYGAEVSIPLPDGLDFASAQTSQGYAVPEGRTVRFKVGSLAVGSAATILLNVIPVQHGTISGIGLFSVNIAPELTDPVSTNNTVELPALQATAPTLAVVRSGNLVEVRWQSDTDRLEVEETGSLAQGAVWTNSTNAVEKSGSNRTARHSEAGQSRFFRLKFQ